MGCNLLLVGSRDTYCRHRYTRQQRLCRRSIHCDHRSVRRIAHATRPAGRLAEPPCHRSALFTLFTVVLLMTHVRLIIFNQSTVETMRAQEMKEREKAVLKRMYPWYKLRYVLLPAHVNMGHSSPNLAQPNTLHSAKREARRQWDQEWGRIDEEGNLWWLGSRKENWISVMGPSKWAWFCECLAQSAACPLKC